MSSSREAEAVVAVSLSSGPSSSPAGLGPFDAGEVCGVSFARGAADGAWWFFDTSGFPARWDCGDWAAPLGWLHIVSDTAIWLAYMTIPMTLWWFVHKRRTPLPHVIWLFIAFIFACGLGHLLEAVIFWKPYYRLAGVWKAITAVVSLATAVVLVPVVPKVLRWPTLADINARMSDEIEVRKDTERRLLQVNAKLEETRGMLEQKNRELEQFVYTASHDLKAPLVTIVGYASHLTQDVEAGELDDIGEYASRIRRAAERMRAEVDDLLELSRIGRVRDEPEWVDLAGVIGELKDRCGQQIEEADVSIVESFEAPRVHADRHRITQALQNLLVNAIIYGRKEDGRIEVGSMRHSDREIRVYVRDNGPGIDPAHHERIFAVFQRLDTGVQGTGVGLAIVRRVAESYGGRAWVESEPGEGATFWISLDQSEAGGDDQRD